MAQRKAFLLRLPPDLHAALERWAAEELRSVNGQIEYLLSRSVKEAGRGPRRPAGGDASVSTETAGEEEERP